MTDKRRLYSTMPVMFVYFSFNYSAAKLTSPKHYIHATRLVLFFLLDALAKGTDPDRMKGALYVLWNKGTGAVP
jgi:hypothetical protein